MPFIIEAPPAGPQQLTEDALVASSPLLLDDLPPFEQDSRDIQGFLQTTGNELARVESARLQLQANFFPRSASALLGFFEAMLGLPVQPPLLTLAERRQGVLAFMRAMKSGGSAADWIKGMNQMIGTGWTYRLHNPDDPASPPPYTLLIRVPFVGQAAVPTGVTPVAQTATGVFTSGTYYYAVTSLTVYGETLASSAVAVTLSGGENTVLLTWDSMPAPLVSYNIYRGLGPTTMGLIASVAANPHVPSLSITDDGSVTPGVAPPTEDQSGSLRAATVLKFARAITPAHLSLTVGYTTGFLIGISAIGIEPL